MTPYRGLVVVVDRPQVGHESLDGIPDHEDGGESPLSRDLALPSLDALSSLQCLGYAPELDVRSANPPNFSKHDPVRHIQPSFNPDHSHNTGVRRK